MRVHGLPFLTISEFLRAKIKAWSTYVLRIVTAFCPAEHVLIGTAFLFYDRRCLAHDAQDITWALTQYWQTVDINRIPEQDMERFVLQNPAALPAWTALKNRYGS